MKWLFLLAFVLPGLNVSAQKILSVKYFDQSGAPVADTAAAYFKQIVELTDTVAPKVRVKEIYLDGKPKLEGSLLPDAYPQVVYHGSVTLYNREGQKTAVRKYVNGSLSGMTQTFYPNGKVESIVIYGMKDGMDQAMAMMTDGSAPPKYKVASWYDPDGNALVTDGKGHYRGIRNDGPDNRVEEEGDYANGVKAGTWTSRFLNKDWSYTEIYDQGKFVSGVSRHENKEYPYTQHLSVPEYRGGIQLFYKYLSSSVRLPQSVKALGIAGKVLLSFIVDQNGKPVEIKVIKGLHPDLDAEAVRVLKQSPAWIPGKQRGVPVRVAYTLPITFG